MIQVLMKAFLRDLAKAVLIAASTATATAVATKFVTKAIDDQQNKFDIVALRKAKTGKGKKKGKKA